MVTLGLLAEIHQSQRVWQTTDFCAVCVEHRMVPLGAVVACLSNCKCVYCWSTSCPFLESVLKIYLHTDR